MPELGPAVIDGAVKEDRESESEGSGACSGETCADDEERMLVVHSWVRWFLTHICSGNQMRRTQSSSSFSFSLTLLLIYTSGMDIRSSIHPDDKGIPSLTRRHRRCGRFGAIESPGLTGYRLDLWCLGLLRIGTTSVTSAWQLGAVCWLCCFGHETKSKQPLCGCQMQPLFRSESITYPLALQVCAHPDIALIWGQSGRRRATEASTSQLDAIPSRACQCPVSTVKLQVGGLDPDRHINPIIQSIRTETPFHDRCDAARSQMHDSVTALSLQIKCVKGDLSPISTSLDVVNHHEVCFVTRSHVSTVFFTPVALHICLYEEYGTYYLTYQIPCPEPQ